MRMVEACAGPLGQSGHGGRNDEVSHHHSASFYSDKIHKSHKLANHLYLKSFLGKGGLQVCDFCEFCQNKMMQSGDGTPHHYGHHAPTVPMDLHMPQPFSYYRYRNYLNQYSTYFGQWLWQS